MKWSCALVLFLSVHPSPAQVVAPRGTMRFKEGQVTFERPPKSPQPASEPQPLDFGDKLETAESSWAVVEFTDLNRFKVRELSALEIIKPSELTNKVALRLNRGGIYVADLPRMHGFQVQTPRATKVTPDGTEFLIEVQGDQTRVVMFDGQAELRNEAGSVLVRAGEHGVAKPGQMPWRARLEAQSLVQWWLYYPGVLDVKELPFTPEEQTRLEASLKAYRSGALPEALRKFPGYPAEPALRSEAERLFYAGLLLSVGAVDRAQQQLSGVDSNAPLARALRAMRASVAGDVAESSRFPAEATTASECLALSYLRQAQHRLEAALHAASAATNKSSDFGFAWERVAELEFSLGHTRQARRALQRALALAPGNAQAHALHGFVLSADNQIDAALDVFDEAIRVDPGLGNAWLGRGLCRIRKGQTKAGLQDLQMAALLEPNRSLLHSYLGKALSRADGFPQALKELEFANRLDTNDPTPWLYSALLKREENRINEAVEDLERSIDLNDNRAVYRSRYLLDQDRAVRSSSLANLYQSAGMDAVSIREAARAVSYDFANYSAHQFLSESYGALRDPTRFNLRYETPWFNERLLANLLSPVGGTPLSPYISQEEYSRLFERNRIGLSSDTSYRSDGQVWEVASQYGTVDNTAWALDLDYQHNDGVRPNNELDRLEWFTTFKQQLTPQDSVLLLAEYQDYHSGDNFQYFDPTNASPYYTFDEYQKPILVGAYHHEWTPGVHTMLLGGWLQNEQQFSDQGVQVYLFATQGTNLHVPGAPLFDVAYRNDFDAYTVELTQVLQNERNTLLVGGRYQGGSVETWNNYTLQGPPDSLLPGAQGTVEDDFERVSAYGYYTLKIVDPLLLTAGVSYDRVTYPTTFRNPPVTQGATTTDLFGPKAALVWSPRKEITVRGAYTRSLGGVTLDQSYRLEPTQLAGFVQTYRSLISESLVGSVSAPEFETAGAALDLKFATRTYAGLQFENLRSEVRRQIGVFEVDASSFPPPPAVVSSTPENLDYTERSVTVMLNQLLSDEWALGAQYRFTRSELHTTLPAVPLSSLSTADQTGYADLQEVSMYGLFNHRCGIFARLGLDWFIQDNWQRTFVGGVPAESDLPGDQFPQLNLLVGYRFPKQRGDITVGGLNLTGDDYHLNPLTPYMEMPRERVFYARLRFRF